MRSLDIRNKSPMVKLAVVFILMAIAYTLFAHLVTPFFLHSENNPLHGFFPQDQAAASNSIFIVSFLISIAMGLIAAYYLRINWNFNVDKKIELKQPKRKNKADLKILKRIMTDDEKKLVGEIEKSGEITQDSLRLRLDWSKAKVSTVLSILDRQGVVQKERSGKTYRVRLDPSLGKKTV